MTQKKVQLTGKAIDAGLMPESRTIEPDGRERTVGGWIELLWQRRNEHGIVTTETRRIHVTRVRGLQAMGALATQFTRYQQGEGGWV